ncbi:MAG TPA: VCBS repeat-containing protein [Puia sp.]|nr:VCBS repeat-containing protein [Puia sp.]
MIKIRILVVAAIALCVFSCRKKTQFELIGSAHSGIHFNNTIVENDSINPLDLTNIYNGGGVGIGDFNNDGLPDIYFTGNTVSNKLYLNKGNLVFEDITDIAGVGGNGEWCRGAAVVDVNNDGLPDIYVCANIKQDPRQRTNLLYVNQGVDAKGIPHFKEMGVEYGLADTLYSTMATFFDYDNDGRIDMYLTVNGIPKGINPNNFRKPVTDGSFPSTGHLYRNEWNDSLKHPVFRDVSKQAGITIEGFGHAATIADINRDGWKDIYVTNDFTGNDILYINNRDGTFTNKIASYFKHTSANGMGQDIEDVNNDGLADLVELDMNPPDNYRKKMFLNPSSYLFYQNSDQYGYQYQYIRNSLQLNQGPRVEGDSAGDPVFSEISWLSGIAETDWSWTPMLADFDNDGYRDLIVTGGYPKDITDHDFQMFMRQASNIISHEDIMKQIPEVKIHNFAFRNKGDLTFADVSEDWGMMTPGFSNGAAYADLDGDGDLDLVVNNINDEARIYKNMARERGGSGDHFLRVVFSGDSLNRGGLGAWVELHYDHGKQQVYENNPYRGYLSTIENAAHFGLGPVRTVDTMLIRWPDGKAQTLYNVACDQVVKTDWRKARDRYVPPGPRVAPAAVFRDITDSAGIHYRQKEKDYIDFNVQKLLPHKFSQYGPGIAVGDVDGNGLDDLVVGGSANYSAEVFLQQSDGRFVASPLLKDSAAALAKLSDDEGILLFDADGDGDMDLYIAAGGYEHGENSEAYTDRLYINDGHGHFALAPADALPSHNVTSKFCVRAADYDHDGRPDLFVSGRVDPGHYPQPVTSFIYHNETVDGRVRFVDVTAKVAPGLEKIGMVCDGIWTDIDNDGWPDLVLAGEWMPLTVFKNERGIFRNVTGGTGESGVTGWWNSIVAGDFDNDGDIDYVVGNLGLNSYYKADAEHPVRVYGKDFDNNGVYDMLTSLYLPDQKGRLREFPAIGRDDLLRQMNSMRHRFPSYRDYAVATMDKVLTPEDRNGATILTANQMRSCLFRNDGGGKFTMIPLPVEAQFSVINGMVAGDFDGDGNLDIVMSGNDYGTEVSTGRYDAMNGLLLRGDGSCGFFPATILQSGIFIPGDGKALVALRGAGGHYLLAAGQNRGPLKVFKRRMDGRQVALMPSEVAAMVRLKDGRVRREEYYYGESFLSQSGRFMDWNGPVVEAEIVDEKGRKRVVR